MERLSLEQLKVQKEAVVKENLEAIKGGDVEWCHVLREIERFLFF